jgi:hypothetical protein
VKQTAKNFPVRPIRISVSDNALLDGDIQVRFIVVYSKNPFLAEIGKKHDQVRLVKFIQIAFKKHPQCSFRTIRKLSTTCDILPD